MFPQGSHLWHLLTDAERLVAYRFGRLHSHHSCAPIIQRQLLTGVYSVRCFACRTSKIIREGVNIHE